MTKRGNGEGSLFQRRDGRWVCETYVLLPDGARTRRTIYGRTRAEVNEKLTALARQTQSGVPAASGRMTLEDYLSCWLVDVVHGSVRPSTFRAYEMFVRVHLVPALGRHRLERLSAADVRRLVNAKLASGLSVGSVRKMHAVLRAALEQAMRDDLLVRNVAKLVRVPTARPPEVQAYSPAEARELLSAASEDRLYALWAVAMGIGLRKGEALGLRWSDVNLEAGWLRVCQTLAREAGGLVFAEPKTARSRRTVPLPSVCVEALRRHRERQDAERAAAEPYWDDHGLVFCSTIGTPIDPDNVNRAFDKLCATAGVRRVRVHDLRHTCATLLLAQGVPARVVMEILGHSQISVTLNTYTHVVSELQQDAMNRIDDVFDPPPADDQDVESDEEA